MTRGGRLSTLLSARPSRTLALASVGAVLGLLIAGMGLFTAQGTRTANVPPEDVAVVNHVPILLSDYLVQLRSLYDLSLAEATPAQRRQVLDDMIQEELYVQRGVELGTPTDDIDVRRALVTSVEAQAVQDVSATVPSETELRAFFDTHRAEFVVPGSLAIEEVVVPAAGEARAPALAAALAKGAPLRDLGLVDARRVDGLEFDWAARLHLGPALFAAAKRLRPGGVYGPARQPDGLHLIRVTQNIAPVPRSFEEVKPDVLTRYRDTQAKLLRAAMNRFLRRRADIKIAARFR